MECWRRVLEESNKGWRWILCHGKGGRWTLWTLGTRGFDSSVCFSHQKSLVDVHISLANSFTVTCCIEGLLQPYVVSFHVRDMKRPQSLTYRKHRCPGRASRPLLRPAQPSSWVSCGWPHLCLIGVLDPVVLPVILMKRRQLKATGRGRVWPRRARMTDVASFFR